MNKILRHTFLILALLLSIGCCVSKQSNSSLETGRNEPDLISFLVLNIHNDTTKAVNIVELVSKKESTGKIKKQLIFSSENYLTIHTYSGKRFVDSLVLEHPLYKHIEYLDENKNFAVMDTVIRSAEFFVRVQGGFNEIRIFETLKNKSKKLLNTIKL